MSASHESSVIRARNFQRFLLLPAEIRMIIWIDAISARMVRFESLYGTLERLPPPPLLSVCQESRMIALEHYELWSICQQARGCRPLQMTLAHIVYPWPPAGETTANGSVNRYQSRHSRYLDRQKYCGCYCYVNFDLDIFVVGDSFETRRKWRLTMREAPRDARRIRHLAFTNIGQKKSLRAIVDSHNSMSRSIGAILSKHPALENVWFVLDESGIGRSLNLVPLIGHEYAHKEAVLGRRLLEKVKRVFPEWQMPSLAFGRLVAF